jgi:hypothetical protein
MGNGGIAPRILNLVTISEANSLLSRSVLFTPGERFPGTRWIESWVGPRASVDAVARRGNVSPSRESNPGRPSRSWALLAQFTFILPCQETVFSADGPVFITSSPLNVHCCTPLQVRFSNKCFILTMVTLKMPAVVSQWFKVLET